jgi:phytoene dehydrogenase-like protein
MRKFDVICIGSGIGSLSVASVLAQLYGHRVAVLERHSSIGGYTASFLRDGRYEWDVGLHYVGSMARGGISRRLMDFVTGSAVRWNKLPTYYDYLCFPDEVFRLPAGKRRFMGALKQRFPEEADGLDLYFADLEHVNQWYHQFLGERTGISPHYLSGYLPVVARPLEFYLQTTMSYMNLRFRSRRLIAVLVDRWGLHGMPPEESVFCLHAITMIHYMGGGWYPKGGSSVIPKAVESVLQRHGGRVFTGHRVEGLVLEGTRAVGVKCAHKGRRVFFRAPIVISGIGVYNTYRRLIPPRLVSRSTSALIERVSSRVTSCVWLFMGLSRSPEALGIRGQNYYLNTGYDPRQVFASKESLLLGSCHYAFLSFPSLKGGRLKDGRQHTAEILAFVDYDEWRRRVDSGDRERTKQFVTETLLSLADYHLPHFSSLIEYTELSSPETSEKYLGHHRGAIYGLPMTRERLLDREVFRSETPVRNLFLVGADALAPGIKSSMLSGILTAAKIKGSLDLSTRLQVKLGC